MDEGYEGAAMREMVRLAQRAGRLEAQRYYLIEALERVGEDLGAGRIEAAKERIRDELATIKDRVATGQTKTVEAL